MSQFKLTADYNNESIIVNIDRTIRALDKFKSWQVEIKPYRKNRSKEQNAFYWAAFIPAIQSWYADSRGIQVSVEAIHEELKELYCPHTVETGTTGEEFRLYKSTTKLTTREWNEMIEKMAADFACMGCDTPLPDPDWKKNKRKAA